MIKLHKKDLRILQELDLDARQPVSAIARKVGLSKETTNYRIRQLENKGIIKGYYSLFNVALLGYNLYKVYLKLQNISKRKEADFIKYLNNIKQVGLIATSSGNYDLEIGIVGKSLIDFHDILDKIIKDYGICIKSKDVTTNIEMWQYSRKYLVDGNQTSQKAISKIKEFYYYGKDRSNKFDEKDIMILRYLQHNGRQSSTEISKALGLSRKIISYRIRNLIKNNIILGFRPIIDRDVLGLAYFRVLIKLQAIKEERLQQMFGFFRQHPNIVYLIKCIGPWELEIELEVEDSKRCHDIVMDIKHGFHDIISDAQIIEIFKDYKYEFSLS
jgi:Lrp/AsnC family leucine-responsive transcriptional regulator